MIDDLTSDSSTEIYLAAHREANRRCQDLPSEGALDIP